MTPALSSRSIYLFKPLLSTLFKQPFEMCTDIDPNISIISEWVIIVQIDIINWRETLSQRE